MPARFEATALFEFLGRVDRELTAPCTIFLIGGSAVSIIAPAHSTSDVDLLSPGSEEFDAAVARLRARGEPVLPVQVVGIAEAPEDIHRLQPFEVETLVARYHETEVAGPRRTFALALLDLIARLFGEGEANKHRALLD